MGLLLEVSKFVFSILFLLSLPFLCCILMFFVQMAYLRFKKGYKLKKGFKPKLVKRSILKRLYVDFPRRWALDVYERDPDQFKEYGLHMFCGHQGSGKTISMVHLIQSLQAKYPKLQLMTNMEMVGEDFKLSHWRDLIDNTNGEKGMICVLDEIQNWFNSMQSKNFPPEMLTEISQQRKQQKMLIGTSQVFSRIAKPIREQTTFVYCPRTILGCLTIVRRTRPEFWNDEKQIFTKFEKTYFFVHDDKIRNAFDTYKKIEKYSTQGFKETSDFVPSSKSDSNFKFNVDVRGA